MTLPRRRSKFGTAGPTGSATLDATESNENEFSGLLCYLRNARNRAVKKQFKYRTDISDDLSRNDTFDSGRDTGDWTQRQSEYSKRDAASALSLYIAIEGANDADTGFVCSFDDFDTGFEPLDAATQPKCSSVRSCNPRGGNQKTNHALHRCTAKRAVEDHSCANNDTRPKAFDTTKPDRANTSHSKSEGTNGPPPCGRQAIESNAGQTASCLRKSKSESAFIKENELDAYKMTRGVTEFASPRKYICLSDEVLASSWVDQTIVAFPTTPKKDRSSQFHGRRYRTVSLHETLVAARS
jgi:hypothetical protein